MAHIITTGLYMVKHEICACLSLQLEWNSSAAINTSYSDTSNTLPETPVDILIEFSYLFFGFNKTSNFKYDDNTFNYIYTINS